jgi:hypothetical protein
VSRAGRGGGERWREGGGGVGGRTHLIGIHAVCPLCSLHSAHSHSAHSTLPTPLCSLHSAHSCSLLPHSATLCSLLPLACTISYIQYPTYNVLQGALLAMFRLSDAALQNRVPAVHCEIRGGYAPAVSFTRQRYHYSIFILSTPTHSILIQYTHT